MDAEQKRLVEELLFTGHEKPSFAKMLYFGYFDGNMIFPYPQVPEDEKQSVEDYIANLAEFAEKHIDADKIDREAKIPDEVIRGLGKLGVLGMSIPKEYGGVGISQYGYCRVMETLAQKCGSTALFVNAHQSVGMKALLLFGTQEQKDRWLPQLARGDAIAAFSLTEPNAGSDAAGIETRAVFNEEKNTYTITGKKQWTTNGGIADILTVMAKTPVKTARGIEDKVTAFLVTPDMPGFRVVDKSLEKVGMRGTWTANLAFDGVEVSAENILGPKGGGLRVCLTVLDYGRTTFGATCTGVAKYLVKRAIDHAHNRHQFGRPLASFGLVKKMLARMSVYTYAMEATTYLTAGLLDKGEEDIMLEASILKVFASEALWQTLYDTMQIFGGRSFFTDEPFERMMRDARLNMIGEGSNEVLKAFIGVVGMRDVGVNIKGFVDALKRPWTSPKTIWSGLYSLSHRMRDPVVPVNSPLLKEEAALLSRALKKFGFNVLKVLARYREEVVEKQFDLERISFQAISIYTAAAVLSKLDTDLTKRNPATMQQELAMGKFYCRTRLHEMERMSKALFSPRDLEVEKLADQLTGITL